MKSNRTLLIGIAVCAACLMLQTQAKAEDAFAPAQVMDISDRAYEPAVIKLLHGAKDTITMSMYTVSVGAAEPNPLSLLLDDLLDARKRGVAVTIYLNTKFKNGGADLTNMEKNPSLEKMRSAGCAIEFLSPYKRLHDKLIVVDSRYVVEGSTNWSISALRDNFESATLIDSPELARVKLARIASLPLAKDKTEPAKKEPHRPVYLEGLPGDITIPQALVTDKRYFAAMTSRDDARAMDAYFILKARSITFAKRDLMIDLEEFAVSLGCPAGWTDSDLRRQAIRALRDLEARYGLIKAKFFFGRDANVVLTDPAGAQFSVDSVIVRPELELKHSVRVKFYRILAAYLAGIKEDIGSISPVELARRFGVSHWTIEEARKAVK